MQKMNIVYKRLDELRPYENNAKTHPESQLANIAHSIENYGWKQPVVIDPYGVIIVRHGRVQAAQRSNVLRDQLVPCIIADDLTEEEIAQFRIVDNKSAESPWDMDALAAELEKVDLSGFDFDFGFDYQMQCSTHIGDSVLDLFAGSGTTIIAAEQNGRRAYCMEFDPHYVDVIIDRWEKFTGERAVMLNE